MKSKFFNIIISTIVIFSLLNISVPVSAYDAIPAVVEQNISKMEKISDHGAKFVVDYISESWDYQTVQNILDEIQTLSDELCADCSNDYEKICTLANYVSSQISYDFDAKHNAVTFDVISIENVLEKKRTTCAGFSNLFSILCNAQGLYCVNIRGSAVNNEDGVYSNKLDDENTVMNHEWTAVYYNDESRWVYVDCTWNSTNTYQNGEFSYGTAPRDTYLDISVEELSKNHKAIIVEHREFFDALSAIEPPAQTTSELLIIPETESDFYESQYIENNVENDNNNDDVLNDNEIIQTESSNENTSLSTSTAISAYTTVSPVQSTADTSSVRNSSDITQTAVSSDTEISSETQNIRKTGSTLIAEDTADNNSNSNSESLFHSQSANSVLTALIIIIPVIIIAIIIIKIFFRKKS